jgi:hypothetical protein
MLGLLPGDAVRRAKAITLVLTVSWMACRSGTGANEFVRDAEDWTWDAGEIVETTDTWPDSLADDGNASLDVGVASDTNETDASGTDNENPGHVCGIPIGHKLDDPFAIMDTGHNARIEHLAMRPGRILSQDVKSRWFLWDSQTHIRLAGGEGSVAGHGGPYFLVKPNEVRDFDDGHLVAKLDSSPDVMGVAEDGGYVWYATATALTAWSPTKGSAVMTRDGDYRQAAIYAAASELRVALGPEPNADRIEVIEVDGGGAMTGNPFIGKFRGWFTDGQRFLTEEYIDFYHVLIRIFDPSGDMVAMATATGGWDQIVGGYGSYFWILYGIELEVHSTSGGNPWHFPEVHPPGTRSDAYPAGSALGLIAPGFDVHVAFLAGPEPIVTSAVVQNFGNGVFGSDGIDWVVGDFLGGVFMHHTADSSPSALAGFMGCGWVMDISGSDSGRLAIATASGIWLMEVDSVKPESIIPYLGAHVQLSRDGRILAASEYRDIIMDELRIFDAETGEMRHVWSYKGDYTRLDDFELAGSGTRIAILATEDQGDGKVGTGWKVIDLPTGETILKGGGWPGFYFSPSGQYLAASGGPTILFKDPTKVAEVPGYALGWLDESKLLVRTFETDSQTGELTYLKTLIVDAQGNELAVTGLPVEWEDSGPMQALNAEVVYLPGYSGFFRVSDGARLPWPENTTFHSGGRVSGNHVVFASEGRVVYSIPFDPSNWGLGNDGNEDVAPVGEYITSELTGSGE